MTTFTTTREQRDGSLGVETNQLHGSFYVPTSQIEQKIEEVHDRIILDVDNVLRPDGFIDPPHRQALDQRLDAHFMDLHRATTLGMLTMQFSSTSARRLIGDIAVAAPKERDKAQTFAENCIGLAGEIMDRCSPHHGYELGLRRGSLIPNQVEDLNLKLLILNEKRSAALGGAIVHHLAITSRTGYVHSSLEEGQRVLQVLRSQRKKS